MNKVIDLQVGQQKMGDPGQVLHLAVVVALLTKHYALGTKIVLRYISYRKYGCVSFLGKRSDSDLI